MAYLEMSRNEAHGGGTWAFPHCLWSPTTKRGGGGKWPFWEKVRQVKRGDTIVHLRGVAPKAFFVGWSTASADGHETRSRPPEPGDWVEAESFYRADLSDFVAFDQPINLTDILAARRVELENYFDANNARRGAGRKSLFYVRQSGRLQCLNGAYLSDVDDDLLTALFGTSGNIGSTQDRSPIITVKTGTQISVIRTRQGQARFSGIIRELYGGRCCFPGCQVSDDRFLVASHIARWADNELLRGNPGNGLCLCLQHDRAFELGLFTLDADYRVFVNPKEHTSSSFVARDLLAQDGQKIHVGSVAPLVEALHEHWERVGMEGVTQRRWGHELIVTHPVRRDS